MTSCLTLRKITAVFVNQLISNDPLEFLISIGGTKLFLKLTAYDMQMI